jgi:hypothetical protein
MKNFVIVLFLVVSVSCDSHRGPSGANAVDQAVYFTSFESSHELSGWCEMDSSMLVNDPSPNGGSKSLNTGAGCVSNRPYLTLTLPEGSYILKCWAKNAPESTGGSVYLERNSSSYSDGSISINVQEKRWTFYQTNATVYSSGMDTFKLGVSAGGIVFGNITVDQISIEAVRPLFD